MIHPYREPIHCHDLGRMNIPCSYCRALHWADEKLVNSSASRPQFGTCCDSGQVWLPPPDDPPPEIRELLTSDGPEAINFHTHIHQYNAALAFTSLGVQINERINNGRGSYIFHIHGELCHLVGLLLPAREQPPAYAQLYIYDPDEALHHRISTNSNLDHSTMEHLQTVLTAIYKHAYEVLADEDCRQYNLPTTEEIAVIMPELERNRNGNERSFCICTMDVWNISLTVILHMYCFTVLYSIHMEHTAGIPTFVSTSLMAAHLDNSHKHDSMHTRCKCGATSSPQFFQAAGCFSILDNESSYRLHSKAERDIGMNNFRMLLLLDDFIANLTCSSRSLAILNGLKYFTSYCLDRSCQIILTWLIVCWNQAMLIPVFELIGQTQSKNPSYLMS
ncbi:hypothetical protein A0H81_02893 [Grifola frondosa]|uniref:Helitron helicase-like domain-containing protein n=1 Tax=Grifola frondosa TaxID=5627 RepID=A0A1C7MME6_GRIFR|nr:hypothetical protein A0H81_02893 [Grifola frondosa]